jgi:SAM-dependent methyltransferase
MNTFNEFKSGLKLFGDDFTIDQIVEWFDEEKEGYANLGSIDSGSYSYNYHSLNKLHGFSFIDDSLQTLHALGIGSAFGLEFEPILSKLSSITIIEPSDNLVSEKIGNLKPIYLKPTVQGKIEIEANSIDIITCFGTLHHIPNVTFVMDEMLRVLKPNGLIILREPIVSMGDWTKPRVGLTKNERGIPLSFFEDFIKSRQLKVINKAFCFCGTSFLTKILKPILGNNVLYTNSFYILFDKYFSKIMSWNIHYYSINKFNMISPDSIFFVLKKP